MSQAEALNKELEAFNYSVPHDPRAPLRRINGFVTALERACEEGLTSKRRELISEVLTSTENMTSLIEALLKLASLGRSDLHYQETDLSLLAHIESDTIVAYKIFNRFSRTVSGLKVRWEKGQHFILTWMVSRMSRYREEFHPPNRRPTDSAHSMFDVRSLPSQARHRRSTHSEVLTSRGTY
jgi:hypothetical protein